MHMFAPAADLTYILSNFGEALDASQIKTTLKGASGDVDYTALVDRLFA